jgi:hypothetical protein
METPTSIDPARHVRDCTDRLNKTLMKEYLVEICRRNSRPLLHRHGLAAAGHPSPSDHVTELLLVQQDSRSLITHVFVL